MEALLPHLRLRFMSSGVREPVAAGLLYASDPQQLRTDIDSAINGAETEFAGPKLLVHYTGLVQPPTKVWCERVTGHSAMIVWSKGMWLCR